MTFLPVLSAPPAYALSCGFCDEMGKVGKSLQINVPSLDPFAITIPPLPNIRMPLPPGIQDLVESIGGDATRIVLRVGEDTLTSIHNSAGDVVRTLEKANGDVIATVQKAGEDTVKTTYTAANDATVTYVKTWRDIGEQGKRSFEDAVDAGEAAGHFVENQAKSEMDAFDGAVKRMQDGKVVDAMWQVGTERLSSSEENFAKATQESSVINSAAASVAAAYGGPAGAAAYAAWSTYRQTGNADMALRAGLLAAVTSQNGSSVAQMPAGNAGEILKKAAMAGAAGGIAAAAAGGDEQAIKDGFLRSSGAVLVQKGTDELKAYSPEANDAYQAVQCISARDVDCLSKTTWVREKGKILYDEYGKPIIDANKIDPNKYVGKWSQVDPKSAEGQINAIIAQTSKLPKMEAIPILKNKWILTWSLGKEETIKYAQPTVVLTYVGENPPFTSEVRYVEHRKNPIQLNKGKRDTSEQLVVYYVKPADRDRVTKALEEKSIKYTKRSYALRRHKEALSNALICGPDTRIQNLRKVALALMEKGIDIKYIGTNRKYKRGTISIINLKRNNYTVNDPNISQKQVKELVECPGELKNTK
ncbi:hypothetical protein HV782_028440 [Pseudomonas monsensis]|uniref:hypothetical protein n=1 Tax=Pseudomonas monsensis TaxID=2745509 RepID=UPI001647B6C6|nr:hypothetical protein [Pseudomonas monsensis]QXI00408.1 hypothetical protein HV782_028440 [Pseudomonas monsensis]